MPIFFVVFFLFNLVVDVFAVFVIVVGLVLFLVLIVIVVVVVVNDGFEFERFFTGDADHFPAFVAGEFVSFVEFFLVKIQSGGT